MNGDIKAKYELAKKYFYGNGVERDYEQAQMWYGLATAAGHSFAKYELGKWTSTASVLNRIRN
ncbi:MAG: sel1 repeat family protein [Ruminococcaceae bacterium]|nr:sel1 repeat family protein [Oscillospiraceae bacterium]